MPKYTKMTIGYSGEHSATLKDLCEVRRRGSARTASNAVTRCEAFAEATLQVIINMHFIETILSV